MPDAQIVRRCRFEAPAEFVFAWHARPGALERLAPPWERVEVLGRTGGIEDGEVVMRVGPRLLARRWVARHRDFVPGRRFRDEQVEGPFARFVHTHSVEPDGDGASHLEDRIEYALPFGAAGRVLGGRLVARRLDRLLRYRHRVTLDDVAAHAAAGRRTMRVAVSGSTGLVGAALVPMLTTGGHEVVRLVRSRAETGREAAFWDPATGEIDAERLTGLDAVVHLAGESIAQRWTEERKRRMRRSRVEATRLLCESLVRLPAPPATFVCASAIGYYGDRGDEPLTEESAEGHGFLPELARDWEAAAGPARAAGVRVVNLRLGIVLSPRGGALAKMLLPFRLGVGGRVGSGRQWWSWVALDDVVGAIHHALVHDPLAGPVNVTAPHAVTNAEFTRVLGRVLGRPTVFPLPAFVARAALGEMADDLLLTSARVLPDRLAASGYAFRFPDLEPALRHTLGRPSSR